MKTECEMGMVLACQVEQCSYNRQRECRAGQIEVGSCSGGHAMCDTFTTEQIVEMETAMPMVAGCDIYECKFNKESGTCRAPAVSLGHHERHAECDSYVPEM